MEDKKDILISLHRYELQKDRTFGLLSISGSEICYTIEDTVRDPKIKIAGKTAIPYGIYKLGTRISPKMSNSYYYSDKSKSLICKEDFLKLKIKSDYAPHKMIWLLDVKNEFISFEFVLIHWGNSELDTDGCLIVGSKKTNNQVLESRVKYIDIYSKIYEQIKLGDKYIEIK